MGIADFGVAPGPKAYTYSTTEFLANLSWQSIDLSLDGDAWFTNQLNVVLEFVQGGITYAYWIQDVAIMNSSTGLLEFENNIWNLSTPSYCLSNTALSGNGTVYSLGGCEGYYAVGAFSQPGAEEFMSTPGHYSLMVRSYTSGGGEPEVAFEYNDGVTAYEVTYDNVVWPWAKSVTTDNNFLVDGNATAPSGNFYDAEFDLGGPGGGSETEAQSMTDIHSELRYWNGHNFEAPRATWNFGGDTGERVYNVQSTFSSGAGGVPLTTQLNGTAKNATPEQAYGPTQVGVLSIEAPAVSAGSVSVDGTITAFVDDWANLTLLPGAYSVWVNSTSSHTALGSCLLVGGATLRVTLPAGCSPEVTTPTAAPTGIDVGQTVAFETTLSAAGTGGDTFDWGSLSSDLGCTPSTDDTISCTPTIAGTYPVQVSVTDSSGQSNSSGVLEFTVDSDPEVSGPSAAPSSVETGASVTFHAAASGGSGGYAYGWSGLPTPCSGAGTDAPTCEPSAPGNYSVSVEVTDSHGGSVASGDLNYTVLEGPSISSPAASPGGPIELGAEVNFTVSASSGTPPYTISWSGLPTGCASANRSTIPCRPTAAGEFNISADVVDSSGGSARGGPAEFVVEPALLLGAPTASPRTVDADESVTFSSDGAVGGSGVYSYSWTGLPAGCASANVTQVSCTPESAGNYTIRLQAQDTNGDIAAANLSLRVDPALSVGSLAVSRTSVDVGQGASLTVLGVAGGSGVYSYDWGGLPSGCPAQNSSIVRCIPDTPGNYSVGAEVVDTNGATVTLHGAITVDALLTVGTPLSTGPSPVVGASLNLTVVISGGSGNFQYTWGGLPIGCVSENRSSLECDPTESGGFSITVTVVDSNGASATSLPLELTVGGNGGTYGLTNGEIALLVLATLGAIAVVVAVVARRRPPPRSGRP